MLWDAVEKYTIDCYEIESRKFGTDWLHIITVTGPINREKREALYEKLLSFNNSEKFYCIVDNLGEHENKFTFEDIRYFDELLARRGITEFFGATVTRDAGYGKIVSLANVSMQLQQMKGEVIDTDDMKRAEAFIFARMQA